MYLGLGPQRLKNEISERALEEWLKLAVVPAAAVLWWEVPSNATVVSGAEVPPEVLEHMLCEEAGREGGVHSEVAVLTALCWKFSPFQACLHRGSITACRESEGVGNSLPFRWLLGPMEKEAARTLEASHMWIRLKITSNYHLV